VKLESSDDGVTELRDSSKLGFQSCSGLPTTT